MINFESMNVLRQKGWKLKTRFPAFPEPWRPSLQTIWPECFFVVGLTVVTFSGTKFSNSWENRGKQWKHMRSPINWMNQLETLIWSICCSVDLFAELSWNDWTIANEPILTFLGHGWKKDGIVKSKRKSQHFFHIPERIFSTFQHIWTVLPQTQLDTLATGGLKRSGFSPLPSVWCQVVSSIIWCPSLNVISPAISPIITSDAWCVPATVWKAPESFHQLLGLLSSSVSRSHPLIL